MNKEPKTAVLKVRCEPSFKQDLQRFAIVYRLDLSDVVRVACANHISQYERPQPIPFAHGKRRHD